MAADAGEHESESVGVGNQRSRDGTKIKIEDADEHMLDVNVSNENESHSGERSQPMDGVEVAQKGGSIETNGDGINKDGSIHADAQANHNSTVKTEPPSGDDRPTVPPFTEQASAPQVTDRQPPRDFDELLCIVCQKKEGKYKCPRCLFK